MILVHGGGCWRGCKLQLEQVAAEASAQGGLNLSHYYVVLNIDYRLACDPSDPSLQNSPILPLCGWNYPKPDSDGTGRIGAATHDVQDAVRWVTSTWQHLPGRPAWNSEDHTMYALDALTGLELWSYQTGGILNDSPALADGVLCFGSFDRNLYAFHLPE